MKIKSALKTVFLVCIIEEVLMYLRTFVFQLSSFSKEVTVFSVVISTAVRVHAHDIVVTKNLTSTLKIVEYKKKMVKD